MQLHSHPHTSRKRTSRSPEPYSHKRKPGPAYTPDIYSNLPPAFARSLSVEALGPNTPLSQRSSPGLDWLHQTEHLQLHTPPTTADGPTAQPEWPAQADGMDEDVGMAGGDEHAMTDEPPLPPDPPGGTTPSYPPPAPAAPFQHHASHLASLPSSFGIAFPDPTFMPLAPSLSSPAPAPRAPHDAPPLHHHLAGSPQALPPSAGAGGAESSSMTPSSSGGSLHSLHSHSHAPGPPHAPGDHPMSPSAPRAKGGWKVTMGYRPDCEKCQQRVQGHYSHVVWNQ
ncbi:hypothetical protein JCM10207_000981 [Rhodosporidiobolus poonsookiae]